MADEVLLEATPKRILEVARRLLLVLLVAVAAVVASLPIKNAISVSNVDFEAQYHKRTPSVSLPTYIQQELAQLDPQFTTKQSDDWVQLSVQARGHLVFANPNDPAFAGISVDAGPRIVAVKDGSLISYLRLQKADSLSGAEWTFSHPYYRHSIWIAALGLIAFVAIRWKAGENEALYQMWLPLTCDLFGIVMFVTGVFAALAASGPTSVVGVLLAIAGLGFLVAGCSYATFRIQCLSTGVRVTSLLNVEEHPFDCIKSVSIDARSPMLSQSGRSSPYFLLTRIDGRSVGMWVRSSTGISEYVIPHLEKGGVKASVSVDY